MGRVPDAVRAERVDRVHQPDQDARVHGRRQAGGLDADPRRPGDVRRHRRHRAGRPTASSPTAALRSPNHRRAEVGPRAAHAGERVREHSWDAAAETIRRSLDAVLAASARRGRAGSPRSPPRTPRRRASAGSSRAATAPWRCRRPGSRRARWQPPADGVAARFAKKFRQRRARGREACPAAARIDRIATGERPVTDHGPSPPQSAAAARPLDVARRPLALSLRRRTQAPAPGADRALGADHRGALSARVEGERHRRPRLSLVLLVRARLRARARRRPRDPALRRGRLLGAGLGQRPAGDDARGRPHAVLRRHHADARPFGTAAGHGDGASTIRTISPSRAASRTGRRSRTRSGTRARPASGRRCGSSTSAAPTSTRSAGRRTSRATRSASRRASAATAVDDLSIEVTLRHGKRAARARPLPGDRSRGRPLHRPRRPGHRRLPQRAAVEPRAADAARRRPCA